MDRSGRSLCGGTGGGALAAAGLTGEQDDRHGRRDLADLERAVARGWEIPFEVRRAVVESLLRVAINGRPRSAARAAEVLRRMHADNFARERYARGQGLRRDRAGAAAQGEPGPVRTRRVIVVEVESREGRASL